MKYAEFERWFEKTAGYSLTKTDSPACWGGSPKAIKAWELQPYTSPYANGAFLAWQHFKKVGEGE